MHDKIAGMEDILLAADGDVDFASGDLLPADTDRATGQHKRDILMASPGDYKEAPTVGVGAVEYIQDDAQLFLRDVRKQMQADGIAVREVAFDGRGNLIVDGSYEND